LRRAAYRVLEAFKHLGVGKTYGWELVKSGRLPVIRLRRKKTIAKAPSNSCAKSPAAWVVSNGLNLP
jgi:hypothetical protein